MAIDWMTRKRRSLCAEVRYSKWAKENSFAFEKALDFAVQRCYIPTPLGFLSCLRKKTLDRKKHLMYIKSLPINISVVL